MLLHSLSSILEIISGALGAVREKCLADAVDRKRNKRRWWRGDMRGQGEEKGGKGEEGIVKKSKVSAGFHSCHFYSAAIAATAFRALEVYPRTDRYAEDSNSGRWFSWLPC